MSKVTDSNKKVAFSWDEKNAAKIIELYNSSKKDNSKKNLDGIAAAVGAKSAASVRMKLTSLGAYEKVEAVATPTATQKVTKIEKVWSLELILGLKKDALDGLEKGATMAQLETLREAVKKLVSPDGVKKAYADL